MDKTVEIVDAAEVRLVTCVDSELFSAVEQVTEVELATFAASVAMAVE